MSQTVNNEINEKILQYKAELQQMLQEESEMYAKSHSAPNASRHHWRHDGIKQCLLLLEQFVPTDDGNWFELALRQWTDVLNEIGFLDPDVAYRVNSDTGASFTCEQVDLKKLLNFLSGKFESSVAENGFPISSIQKLSQVYANDHHLGWIDALVNQFAASVIRIDHFHCNAYSCKFALEYIVTHIGHKFEQKCEHVRQSLCHEMFRHLVALNNNSKKTLIKFSQDNDYTFDESGHRDG